MMAGILNDFYYNSLIGYSTTGRPAGFNFIFLASAGGFINLINPSEVQRKPRKLDGEDED